jgi:L-lactate permease
MLAGATFSQSFTQSLNPAHSTLASTLIALIPIVLLLVLLPVLKMSAWQAVIIGSVVTVILALTSSRTSGGATPSEQETERPGTREAVRGLVPFGILIAVVVAATGSWSHLTNYNFVKPTVDAISSLSHKKSEISWAFSPTVAGTWILVSWVLICLALRVTGRQLSVGSPASARRT